MGRPAVERVHVPPGRRIARARRPDGRCRMTQSRRSPLSTVTCRNRTTSSELEVKLGSASSIGHRSRRSRTRHRITSCSATCEGRRPMCRTSISTRRQPRAPAVPGPTPRRGSIGWTASTLRSRRRRSSSCSRRAPSPAVPSSRGSADFAAPKGQVAKKDKTAGEFLLELNDVGRGVVTFLGRGLERIRRSRPPRVSTVRRRCIWRRCGTLLPA